MFGRVLRKKSVLDMAVEFHETGDRPEWDNKMEYILTLVGVYKYLRLPTHVYEPPQVPTAIYK